MRTPSDAAADLWTERPIAALLRRPVAVTAGYLLLLALAVTVALRLPTALLPSLRYPSLVIWTAYPDVAPEWVEQSVTRTVEETVAGVAGLIELTGLSQLGGSLVRLDLGWNTDLDLALLEVRQQLDRAAAALPEEAERPVVLRLDPSDRPILVIALAAAAEGSPEALVELRRLGREILARRLEQLEGVARVRVLGGAEPEVEILLSTDKLAAHALDLDQIAGALEQANVALSGGMIRRGPFRYAVEVSGELRGLKDIAATVVARDGGRPVRLGQVAQVRASTVERRGLVRLDGREVVLLLVERRPDANTVEVATAARRALAELGRELPELGIRTVVDESRFIRGAIGGLLRAVIWGGLLAIAVLFVFLRRPQTLAAVACAVPLSAALTLLPFPPLGISINMISLSGLALGVGMLVDNAIVVVENISRLRDLGRSPATAASRGAAQVAGAITASTLTTAAVFLPLTFVEGLAGRLFRDQSLAVVLSLAFSLLVALTVVPLIASRERPAALEAGGRRSRTAALYESLLAGCLERPWTVIGGVACLLAVTALLAADLPREAVPESEEGRVAVHLTLPPDADLSLVELRSAALEEAAAAWPEVATVLADLGERADARLDLVPRPPYEGDLVLVLSPQADSHDLLDRLRSFELPPDLSLQARAVETRLESLLVAADADLLIDLVSERREDAEGVAERVLAALRQRRELSHPSRLHPQGLPAYRLSLDRDALARFGVPPSQVETYIEAAAGGRRTTRLRTVNEEIFVTLHTGSGSSIEELLGQRLPTPAGRQPLARFVAAEPIRLPAVLTRHRQTPVVRLTAQIAPAADLAAAVRAVDECLRTTLGATVRGRISGANSAFQASLRAMASSLLLSGLLVYLILAAQFESFRLPLIILAAVPLSAVGVVLALALTGQSWNLMSLTGCVVLVGIAVNDAIVKLSFIQQQRSAGQGLMDAILAAGRVRLRAILMTSWTTVLGLAPMAAGLGEGGSLRQPLAIAILGGLVSSTLLTLFVLPAIYLVVERRAAARPGGGSP